MVHSTKFWSGRMSQCQGLWKGCSPIYAMLWKRTSLRPHAWFPAFCPLTLNSGDEPSFWTAYLPTSILNDHSSFGPRDNRDSRESSTIFFCKLFQTGECPHKGTVHRAPVRGICVRICMRIYQNSSCRSCELRPDRSTLHPSSAGTRAHLCGGPIVKSSPPTGGRASCARAFTRRVAEGVTAGLKVSAETFLTLSLELLAPQEWFTYQNLQNFTRKNNQTDWVYFFLLKNVSREDLK